MTDPSTRLGIEGGTPVRSAPWPNALAVSPADDAHPVEAFEATVAALLDLPASAVIAYATSEDAYAAALGTPDDARPEAIVAAVAMPQAAQAARSAGWRLVPADVEPDSGTMSLRGLMRATGPETGLIVVHHAFGHPATMTELMRSAREQGITLVEEITGALGATYRREPVGRLGHRAVMASSQGHPLTCSAFVVAPDPEEAHALRSEQRTVLSDETARTALAEVRDLATELEHRRHLAWELTFALHGMRGVAPMAHGRWVQHAYPQYMVRLRMAVWQRSIADTVAALQAEGIPAEVACAPSLHLDPSVRDALPDDPRVRDDVFVASSRLPDEFIAIPLHSGLTSREMEQVAAALRKLEAHST